MQLRHWMTAGVAALLLVTTGFSAGIREKQLDSVFTDEIVKRDGSVAFTGDLPMGTNKITGLVDGTAASDAATKGQLDSVSAGVQTKESVSATSQDAVLDDNGDISGAPAYDSDGGTSTRGQITATLGVSGVFAIDGITLADDDRVLISGEGVGTAEEHSVDTIADVADALDGDYFIFYTNASTAFYVWYNTSGGGATDPAPSPPAGVSYTEIEVAITTNDTANDVALATETAIEASVAEVTGVTVSTNEMTIIDSFGGNVTDAAEGVGTGFTFGVDTVQGTGLGADANGIYTVTILTTSLTLDRATDFDEDAEVLAGSLTLIEGGTVHEGHQHILVTSNPITIGGAGGTSQTWSMFSSLNLGTVGEITTVNGGDVAAAGTSGNAAHADHEHAVATGAASAASPGDAAAEGSSTDLARADHDHSILANVAGNVIQPDDSAAVGVGAAFARGDHEHGIVAAAPSASIDAGDTSVEGSSTSFVRADHEHAVSTGAAADQTPDQASAEGGGTNLARAAHVHNLPAETAIAVLNASGEGTDSSFARSDHEHDSPQMNDSNKLEAAAVTTGTNETTGLTIASTPALATQIWIVTNTVVYHVGDGVDTADYYYSGDACSTPRALTAVVSGDVLCQGDNLPFNHDTSDEISQNFLTFTNN